MDNLKEDILNVLNEQIKFSGGAKPVNQVAVKKDLQKLLNKYYGEINKLEQKVLKGTIIDDSTEYLEEREKL